MSFYKCLLLFFCLKLTFTSAAAQTTAMTYNIRYDNPSDGKNAWEYRKPEVIALIKTYQPDILGIQEALPGQMQYLKENLEGYDHIGFGRDGLNTDSEATPVFYNSLKLELLRQKMFWLSETPEKISRGWDAALNRIAVYGQFRNKATGEILHIINTHFDHQGKTARLRSAELLSDFIQHEGLKKQKVVLMGDLNTAPDQDPVQVLKKNFTDSREVSGIPVRGPAGTFNGFDTGLTSYDRIDYIFIKNLEVKAFECIDNKRTNGLFPSDHFPLLIKF